MTPRHSVLLLHTLFLIPATAFADGMLVPGWEAIAGQALGDIRAAVVQTHPGAPAPSRPVGAADASATQATIDTFMLAAAVPSRDRNPAPEEDRLVATLWQANAGNEALDENSADRVIRAFTLGNATAQLANGVYGGPPGAAAYAAWWAYRQPGGNASQALRVGLLVGAGLWGGQKQPDGADIPARVVQRTSLAAALGGLAIAAAGGSEQTLREVFFDTGAAVLLRDGPRVYCVSASVQCTHPPVEAAVYQNGRVQGWALGQLTPVAAQAGPISTDTPGQPPTEVPAPLRRTSALPLEQGWTLSWQLPEGIARGLLYPAVVLGRGPAPAPVSPAALAAAPPSTSVASRYLCEKHGDVRTIWVEPGGPQDKYLCRTLYQIDKTRAVLWNARQNPEACQAKAKAQMGRETAHGYTCRPSQE